MQMIPIPIQPNSLPGHAFWVIKGRNSRRHSGIKYIHTILYGVFSIFKHVLPIQIPFIIPVNGHETIVTFRTL